MPSTTWCSMAEQTIPTGQFIPFSEALRKFKISAGEGKYASVEPGYSPGVLDELFNPKKIQLYQELMNDVSHFEEIYKKNKGIFQETQTFSPQTTGQAFGTMPGPAMMVPSIAETRKIGRASCRERV